LRAGTQQQRKQWPVLDYVLVFGTQLGYSLLMSFFTKRMVKN